MVAPVGSGRAPLCGCAVGRPFVLRAELLGARVALRELLLPRADFFEYGS